MLCQDGVRTHLLVETLALGNPTNGNLTEGRHALECQTLILALDRMFLSDLVLCFFLCHALLCVLTSHAHLPVGREPLIVPRLAVRSPSPPARAPSTRPPLQRRTGALPHSAVWSGEPHAAPATPGCQPLPEPVPCSRGPPTLYCLGSVVRRADVSHAAIYMLIVLAPDSHSLGKELSAVLAWSEATFSCEPSGRHKVLPSTEHSYDRRSNWGSVVASPRDDFKRTAPIFCASCSFPSTSISKDIRSHSLLQRTSILAL